MEWHFYLSLDIVELNLVALLLRPRRGVQVVRLHPRHGVGQPVRLQPLHVPVACSTKSSQTDRQPGGVRGNAHMTSAKFSDFLSTLPWHLQKSADLLLWSAFGGPSSPLPVRTSYVHSPSASATKIERESEKLTDQSESYPKNFRCLTKS